MCNFTIIITERVNRVKMLLKKNGFKKYLYKFYLIFMT